MNIIRNRILNETDFQITYGYLTYVKRYELGLEKSHINDAFVIADGTSQVRCSSYDILHKRRNNRALQLNRKGFAPSIRRKRYNIQPNDLVVYCGKEYYARGTHCKGKSVILRNSVKNLDINIKKVEKVFGFSNLVWRIGGSSTATEVA